MREAKRFGLHPTDAKVIRLITYTEEQLNRVRKYTASRRAEFERAIKMGLIAPNAKFVPLKDGDWGYRYGDSPIVHRGSKLRWRSPKVREAERIMDKYTAAGGYNIAAALQDGVPVETIMLAGFDYEKDIKPVQLWMKQNAKTLKKLRPYWIETDAGAGYNIEQALKDGVVQPKDLVALGFSRADIQQAGVNIGMSSFPKKKDKKGKVAAATSATHMPTVTADGEIVFPEPPMNPLERVLYDIYWAIKGKPKDKAADERMPKITKDGEIVFPEPDMNPLERVLYETYWKVKGKPALKGKQPDKATLREIMADINAKVEKEIAEEKARYEAAIEDAARTGVALPGEEPQWRNVLTGERVSDAEYKRITDNGTNTKADQYVRVAPQAKRMLIEASSSLFFTPLRSALPETKLKDIPDEEWVTGGAQLATWLSGLAPGMYGTAIRGAAGAVFGASTARHWENMSPADRSLSVAATAALLGSSLYEIVQPSFRPVKVPLKDGSTVTVWSGLSARGKRLVGITKTPPPNITTAVKDWRPLTKLETSVLGTRKALKAMDVPDAEIERVLKTVEEAKAIHGQRSPHEPKKLKAADITPESLTPDELTAVLQEVADNSKKVDMVYGSTTIKPQLEPALRQWRKLGDIEVQLKAGVTEEQAAKLTEEILAKLRRRSPGKFAVDPDDAKRILVKTPNGTTHHAVEIKTADSPSQFALDETYNLGRTGTESWGIQVREKPITVDFPGVGKLRFMRLSESGVRKMDSITRSRGTGTFGPEPHRLKDIVDFYVILRTFRGAKIADEWAAVYGYKPSELLAEAAKNPVRMAAWEFDPAPPSAKVTGAPTVSIKLPESLATELRKASPSLYRKVTRPSAPSAALPSAASSGVSPARSMPASPASSGVSPRRTAPMSPGQRTGTTQTLPGSRAPEGKPTTVPIVPSSSVVLPSLPKRSAVEKWDRRRFSSTSPQKKRGQFAAGEVGWRQGGKDPGVWIRARPAWQDKPRKVALEGDVVYSLHPPAGAKVLKGSPEETFYTRGGKLPKRFLVSIGLTQAIVRPQDRPHLIFRRRRATSRRRSSTRSRGGMLARWFGF